MVEGDLDIFREVVGDRKFVLVAEDQTEPVGPSFSQVPGDPVALDPPVKLSGDLDIQRLVPVADKGFVAAPC